MDVNSTIKGFKCVPTTYFIKIINNCIEQLNYCTILANKNLI